MRLSPRQREIIEKRKRKQNILKFVSWILILLGGLLVLYLVFFRENEPNEQDEPGQNQGSEVDLSYNFALDDEIFAKDKGETTEDISKPISLEDRVDQAEKSPYLQVYKGVSNFVNPYSNLVYSQEEEEELLSKTPEILRNQIEKYPESKNNLILFSFYAEDDGPIDISKEENGEGQLSPERRQVPYFNQWDVRWAFKKIDDTYFSISGCGPTTLASVYVGLTGDYTIDPYKMGQITSESGYYLGKDGSFLTMFSSFVEELGLKGRNIDKSEQAIKEAIDRGSIVVLLVRHNGIGDFTTGAHFISIVNYNEHGDFIILDSNSYENTNVSWDPQRVLEQTGESFEILKQ